MNKKTFTIGVLSITATILLAANFITPHRAMADFAVKERVYTAVTAHVAAGGDALYITDNFTGNMGIFLFQPGQGLQLKGKLNLGRSPNRN
jgi:hypothetical protein